MTKRTIIALFLITCLFVCTAFGITVNSQSNQVPSRFEDPLLEMVAAAKSGPGLMGAPEVGGILPSLGLDKLVSRGSTGGEDWIGCLLQVCGPLDDLEAMVGRGATHKTTPKTWPHFWARCFG